ncbi:hypothetical protein POVCU1_015770 [Plasmodium ovale curtisi]|uniref:Uncharacterized protein n=1 Tax=Plasmodium ovale curtisi TaxID=864141 RepID=A0A1A8WB92_PLAOA|nr:hypothetical protein POVCU1_015770 [Plasmodium ovale curtisi]
MCERLHHSLHARARILGFAGKVEFNRVNTSRWPIRKKRKSEIKLVRLEQANNALRQGILNGAKLETSV